MSNSLKLIDTPNFTEVPNLEKLVVDGCTNLREVHPTIGVHKRLTLLNLKGCKNLSSLPSKLEMESLEILILSGCSKVNNIPEFMENMECLTKLYLDGTAITKLPTSFKHLSGLGSLNLRDCKNLLCLPTTLFNMKSIKYLNISGCSKLDILPVNLGNAESLEELDMGGTSITKLPLSIEHLANLASLNLKDCENLLCLPRTIFNMKSLKDLNLSGCSKLEKLLENMGDVKDLEELNTFTSIEHLTGLTSLDLRDCKNLVCLPDTVFNMKSLKDLNLSGCSKLDRLPENLGNAEGLEELDVGRTAIQKLPSSIVLLKNLKVLSFRGDKGSSSKSWYKRLTFYLMPRRPNSYRLVIAFLIRFLFFD
jgi:Leucine-rich repeat (LRR) protein